MLQNCRNKCKLKNSSKNKAYNLEDKFKGKNLCSLNHINKYSISNFNQKEYQTDKKNIVKC
jgi:hypothetical protein